MNLAEKVFRPDVPTCKGKWVRKKPKGVKDDDTIELPPKLRLKGMEMELAIDVLFINNEAFLHTVDRKIKCPNAVVLGTPAKGRSYDKETLFQGLDQILRKYNRADVVITKIHADNEFNSIRVT